MKQYVSFPIEGKIVFFNELRRGDCLLFLYDSEVKRFDAFKSFIQTGLENNELCLYAFPDKRTKLNLDRTFKTYVVEGRFHSFAMKESKIKMLEMENGDLISRVDDKLDEMYGLVKTKKCTALRSIMDFENMINPSNIDSIIEWKKGNLEQRTKSFPLTAINAFDVSSLDYRTAGALVRLHQKVVISTQNSSTVSLFNFSGLKGGVKATPSLEVVSHKVIEQFVKKNLETIVLSLLQQEPMHGYDVIKTIVQRFHVFLSQGTVYPLLYSLKDQGLLKVEESNTRSKVYSPTRRGKRVIEDKLKDFKIAHEHLLSLVKSDMNDL